MIEVVVIEPEKPENLGAIARVMKNFSVARLIVVNPKFDILNEETLKVAKHAKDVIENTKVVKRIPRYDLLVATTAKLGLTDYNLLRASLSIEDAAKLIVKAKTKRIGILFGREGIGLTNKELAKADIIATIPANKEYPTLNLSHAVGITLYEIFKQESKGHLEKITLASRNERKQLFKLINKTINKLGFKTKSKRDTQRKVWQRVINKAIITKREIFALMGYFRKILKK